MNEDGYSILLWDRFGAGLVLVNARLHEEGQDLYGNPTNWWACRASDRDADLAAQHGLPDGSRYRLLRDSAKA